MATAIKLAMIVRKRTVGIGLAPLCKMGNARSGGKIRTAAKVTPAMMTKSRRSIMRRSWRKMSPANKSSQAPLPKTVVPRRLVRAIANNPPSNPVKATPPKNSKIEIGTGVGLATGAGDGAAGVAREGLPDCFCRLVEEAGEDGLLLATEEGFEAI